MSNVKFVQTHTNLTVNILIARTHYMFTLYNAQQDVPIIISRIHTNNNNNNYAQRKSN